MYIEALNASTVENVEMLKLLHVFNSTEILFLHFKKNCFMCNISINRICGVMVSELGSSVVDHGFEYRSGQYSL
jgi:hypothetical protein